ncbi:MAG: YczE/YyaS/YitT family protein [Bacillota bacterium]
MEFAKKLIKLTFGLFIFSIAIVLTIHSQLGASPWDVFHLGLLNYSSLSLGEISQVVGLVIIVIALALGEMPGIATIFNMYFVGLFIDVLRNYHVIPLAQVLWQQILMLLVGIYLFGWGTYFYLGAGLGSGPRDSLMVGLLKKTKQPVWKIRTLLETSVLIMGYFMGGLVGVGTVLVAGLLGFSIQHVYFLMKGNPAEIVHTNVKDYYLFFKNKSNLTKKAKAAK